MDQYQYFDGIAGRNETTVYSLPATFAYTCCLLPCKTKVRADILLSSISRAGRPHVFGRPGCQCRDVGERGRNGTPQHHLWEKAAICIQSLQSIPEDVQEFIAGHPEHCVISIDEVHKTLHVLIRCDRNNYRPSSAHAIGFTNTCPI